MIVTPQLQIAPSPQQHSPPTVPGLVPRKCQNFLESFEIYSSDGFTPPDFNTWAGISVIAGALERKVWLQWNQTLRYYPNMYILLVSLPGAGKSTAVNRAVGLLEPLFREGRKVNFLPSQVTEAKLIELMTNKATFYYGGKQYFHCSGYYYASEASDSLKEVYGDITSTMTNFYDCPDLWQKATKKDGLMTVENGCLNLLAGSTFNYLGELINDKNVMGGFASRLTYIISKNEEIRKSSFPVVGGESLVDDALRLMRQDLIHDLKRINEMVGPFDSTPEFRAAWEKWDQEFQHRRKNIDSEKMKTLLVRTATSMHKLCMILSAAESSDRILKLPHFERAKSLLASAESALPRIFREARSNNVQTADGLHNSILLLLQERPMSKHEISRKLGGKGFDMARIDGALAAFIVNKTVEMIEDGKLKLLVDSNKYI